MKKKLVILSILLIAVLISSNAVFSQNKVEERADLAKEYIKQMQLFAADSNQIENIDVTVYQFAGTAEEAVAYVKETLIKDGEEELEMELNKGSLSSKLGFFRGLVEQGIMPAVEENWIEEAKNEEEKLKDIEQKSYYGELENQGLEKEITVENPFFSLATFNLEEGTYIIYSEYHSDEL